MRNVLVHEYFGVDFGEVWRTVESLAHFLVVLPLQPVAKLFGTLIRPCFARATTPAEESRTLATLRHTLLPKLISSELQVKDTELFIESWTL